MSGLTPSSVTIRNDLPPTASPQTLSLGNFLFSSNNTLFPAIAAYEAAALPPGPPPTTITSKLVLDSGIGPLSIGASHSAAMLLGRTSFQ